jgi:hypothetical protein
LNPFGETGSQFVYPDFTADFARRFLITSLKAFWDGESSPKTSGEHLANRARYFSFSSIVDI